LNQGKSQHKKHSQINAIDILIVPKSNVIGKETQSHYKVVYPINGYTRLCMQAFWYGVPCTVFEIPMYSPNANAKTHAYKELPTGNAIDAYVSAKTAYHVTRTFSLPILYANMPAGIPIIAWVKLFTWYIMCITLWPILISNVLKRTNEKSKCAKADYARNHCA